MIFITVPVSDRAVAAAYRYAEDLQLRVQAQQTKESWHKRIHRRHTELEWHRKVSAKTAQSVIDMALNRQILLVINISVLGCTYTKTHPHHPLQPFVSITIVCM